MKKDIYKNALLGLILTVSVYAAYILLWYITEFFGGYEGVVAMVLFGAGPVVFSVVGCLVFYRIMMKTKPPKAVEIIRYAKGNIDLLGVIMSLFGFLILCLGYFYISVLLMIWGSLWGWISVTVLCNIIIMYLMSGFVFMADTNPLKRCLLWSTGVLILLCAVGIIVEMYISL